MQADRDNFDATWDQVRNSSVAMGFQESTIETFSVSAEERERIFQDAWDEGGGFRFMFGTFCDIATDEAANEEAAKFIRRKIAEIVQGSRDRAASSPRPTCTRADRCATPATTRRSTGPTSRLVNVKENPIIRMTREGHRHRGRHPARTRRAGVRHRFRRGRRQLHARRHPRPRRES